MQKELTYFISENGPFGVITFVGPMNDRTSPQVNEVIAQISEKRHLNKVILQLREVPQITGEGMRSFTLLQSALRSNQVEVRISSLTPKLKELLTNVGIVRIAEMTDNLASALSSFKK